MELDNAQSNCSTISADRSCLSDKLHSMLNNIENVTNERNRFSQELESTRSNMDRLTLDLSKLQAELDQTKSSLHIVTVERDRLRHDSENISKVEATQRQRALESELQQLREATDELQTQKMILSQENAILKVLNEQIAGSATQLDDVMGADQHVLADQITKLQAAIRTHTAKEAELIAMNETLASAIEAGQEAMLLAQSGAGQEQQALIAQISSLKIERDQLISTNKRLLVESAETTKLRDQVTTLVTQLNQNEERHRKMENMLKQRQRATLQLERRESMLSAELAAMKASLHESERMYKNLSQHVSTGRNEQSYSRTGQQWGENNPSSAHEELSCMQTSIQALRQRLEDPTMQKISIPPSHDTVNMYAMPPSGNGPFDVESLRSDLVRFAVTAKDRLGKA